jgi:hypothetical protein
MIAGDAEREEDERDAAIARRRLEEIRTKPDSLVWVPLGFVPPNVNWPAVWAAVAGGLVGFFASWASMALTACR